MSMCTLKRHGAVAASTLWIILSGCALDTSVAGAGPTRPARAAPPPTVVEPPESVAAGSPHATEEEAAHQEQMRHLHHQGHSKHEFRAIHNMDEMHRMGGVPDMLPLDEYKDDPSRKMGAAR